MPRNEDLGIVAHPLRVGRRRRHGEDFSCQSASLGTEEWRLLMLPQHLQAAIEFALQPVDVLRVESVRRGAQGLVKTILPLYQEMQAPLPKIDIEGE